MLRGSGRLGIIESTFFFFFFFLLKAFGDLAF